MGASYTRGGKGREGDVTRGASVRCILYFRLVLLLDVTKGSVLAVMQAR